MYQDGASRGGITAKPTDGDDAKSLLSDMI